MTADDHRVQRLAYGALDTARVVAELDLAAYLHDDDDAGPELFLGAPALADADPADAFALSTAMRTCLADGRDDLSLPGYDAFVVHGDGPRSRGLFAFGSRARPIDAADRDRLRLLAATFGALIHGSGGGDRAPSIGRVTTEVLQSGARAQVDVAGRGTGTGEAATTVLAIALATCDAVDPALKVLDAGEGDVGGMIAVVAVVEAPNGRRAIGAHLVDDDTDAVVATARATLDAALRLG